jgi:hypothetical protein
MKRLFLALFFFCVFTSLALAQKEPNPAISTTTPINNQYLTVEIVVDRYKNDTNEEWDTTPDTESAPPDVFGEIQLPDSNCKIAVHENSYLVKEVCPATEMKEGTPVSIKLYDRDRMRVDDLIGVGTMTYQGSPTEAQIGSAKVRLLY